MGAQDVEREGAQAGEDAGPALICFRPPC
jgi:hypothetical protein